MNDPLVIDNQRGLTTSNFESSASTDCESNSSSESSCSFPLDPNSVRTWLLHASPAPSSVDSDSDPDFCPPKSYYYSVTSSHGQESCCCYTLRSSGILVDEQDDTSTSSSLQQVTNNAGDPQYDPEYVPPKHVLDELKKSTEDYVPTSDIIVNVKRRKVRRSKKYSDPVCDFRFENEYYSMTTQEEQFFADIGMNQPISTEQLRQILEDSASEEVAKDVSLEGESKKEEYQTNTNALDNLKPAFEVDSINKKITEDVEILTSKMNRSKPPLKIKLRRVNKKTVPSSPTKSKKESNSESDTNSQQCSVPKVNSVLPKVNAQQESRKVTKRKRQTCRKQFRHKDITLYKLGAGQVQEKAFVPKNQVIHKIFARRSSVNASSPSVPKSDVDNPKEADEHDVLLGDTKSCDFNQKCVDDVTVNNNFSQNNLNCGGDNAVKVPLSSVNTPEQNINKLEKDTAQVKLNVENYKANAKITNEIIPQLQIREEKSTNLISPTKTTSGQQMSNRTEIGKHNLPIRIPERRSSIAEPLRTPPVLNKVPSLHAENQKENRTNYIKNDVKSTILGKSEVSSDRLTGSPDKILDINKLQETQLASVPLVKLCRLPDDETPGNKHTLIDIEVNNKQEDKKGILVKYAVETKPVENDTINGESKSNSTQILTKSEKISTNKETFQEDGERTRSCSPQNLSMQVVKSCSGITDPLKLHKPHHLSTKKLDLNSKTKCSNTMSPKDGYGNSQPNENEDLNQPTSSSPKANTDASEIGYKSSSILQQNLLLRPGYKMDPYRNIPHCRNNITASSFSQEMLSYNTTAQISNSAESIHSAAPNFPRGMPVIEDPSQKQPYSNKLNSDTITPTMSSETPKKYKRGKRKSIPESYEDPASKLFRGNNFQSYNTYNYSLPLYAEPHPSPPYSSLAPFQLGVTPSAYGRIVSPPIYQPRPRIATSTVQSDSSGFKSTAPRSVMQPFMTQDPRFPLQYPLTNIPSSESYNTRVSYEQLMRFNNSIFTNHGTLPRDYTATANSNRRNEPLRQSPNSATLQRGFDIISNVVKNGNRQSLYQPFAVPEAHLSCSTKVSESQSTPLALIKNVTASHCNERNMPVIDKKEELTITKLPLRETPLNSAHATILHGFNSKGHEIANLVSPFKKIELNTGNIDVITKICKNNTEIIGPLLYTSNKTEINNKSSCALSEHSMVGKFPHSELASISVSIVKNNEKQNSSPVHHKQVTNKKTSILPAPEKVKLLNCELSNSTSVHHQQIKNTQPSILPAPENVKLINSEPSNSISQKSQSLLDNDIKNVLNNNCSANTSKNMSPPLCFDQQISFLELAKAKACIDSVIVDENIRSPSPYTISDSSTSDAEGDLEIEEKEGDATVKSGNHLDIDKTEKIIASTDSPRPQDKSLKNKEIPEPTSNETSQSSDDFISGIVSNPNQFSNIPGFVETVQAITYVVDRLLDTSDQMSEQKKLDLRHILQRVTKTSNIMKYNTQIASLDIHDNATATQKVKSSSVNVISAEQTSSNKSFDDIRESSATINKSNMDSNSTVTVTEIKQEKVGDSLTMESDNEDIMSKPINREQVETEALKENISVTSRASNVIINNHISNVLPTEQKTNKKSENDQNLSSCYKDVNPVYNSEFDMKKAETKKSPSEANLAQEAEASDTEKEHFNSEDNKSIKNKTSPTTNESIKSNSPSPKFEISNSKITSPKPSPNCNTIHYASSSENDKAESKMAEVLQSPIRDETDHGLNLTTKSSRDKIRDYHPPLSSNVIKSSSSTQNSTNDLNIPNVAAISQNIANKNKFVKRTSNPTNAEDERQFQLSQPPLSLQGAECDSKAEGSSATYCNTTTDALHHINDESICVLDLTTECAVNSTANAKSVHSSGSTPTSVVATPHLTRCSPIASPSNRFDSKLESPHITHAHNIELPHDVQNYNLDQTDSVLNLSKRTSVDVKENIQTSHSCNVIQEMKNVGNESCKSHLPCIPSLVQYVSNVSQDARNVKINLKTSISKVETPKSSPCSVIQLSPSAENSNLSRSSSISPPSLQNAGQFGIPYSSVIAKLPYAEKAGDVKTNSNTNTSRISENCNSTDDSKRLQLTSNGNEKIEATQTIQSLSHLETPQINTENPQGASSKAQNISLCNSEIIYPHVTQHNSNAGSSEHPNNSALKMYRKPTNNSPSNIQQPQSCNSNKISLVMKYLETTQEEVQLTENFFNTVTTKAATITSTNTSTAQYSDDTQHISFNTSVSTSYPSVKPCASTEQGENLSQMSDTVQNSHTKRQMPQLTQVAHTSPPVPIQEHCSPKVEESNVLSNDYSRLLDNKENENECNQKLNTDTCPSVSDSSSGLEKPDVYVDHHNIIKASRDSSASSHFNTNMEHQNTQPTTVQSAHNLDSSKVSLGNQPHMPCVPVYVPSTTLAQQSFYYSQPLNYNKNGDFVKNESTPNISDTRNELLSAGKKTAYQETTSGCNTGNLINLIQKPQESPPLNGKALQTTTNTLTNNNMTISSKSVINSDIRQPVEKRNHIGDEISTSRISKRRRTLVDDRNEAPPKLEAEERIPTYYQTQVPYHPENMAFRMHQSYPPENNEYGRPIRTHLVNEPPPSSEGIVNFRKPSPVLSTKLYVKSTNSDQVVEVSSRNLDTGNHPVSRQSVTYNPVDAINRMNYTVNDNFTTATLYRQTNVRQKTDFANSGAPPSFSDVPYTHTSVNTRVLADLKEKCLRSNRMLQSGASVETNFANAAPPKLSKENQNNLRLNTNVHNFSSNISPDYGYFSPLSKNPPAHFDPAMHHPNSVQYNEPHAGQSLQYRRMSSSSQHSGTDSSENYRPVDTSSSSSIITMTNNNGNNTYVKQNPNLPSTVPNSMPGFSQTKTYQQETSLISQNRNVQNKINSILPKLQRSGTLTPEQYVTEIQMLENDRCPKPFLEFYTYVTRKQISSNHLPISFRIFLEFQNAGKLKDYEKAFKIYSEKHETEKKKITKSN